MTEICAAVGLAQLERVDELVKRRQYIATLFNNALEGCKWMIPQQSPEGVINTYWTYAVKYEGEKELGVSWKEFYDLYLKNGGDGFYGALSLQYLEPAIKNKEWLGTYLPEINLYKDKFNFKEGLCPIAEELQPKIMQFKTNYRNLDIAEEKTRILKDTIKQLS
jgi:perosamine synthetase